jgi:ABC-type dipeptide/oligopeptide/nickel transport system ATPase component
LIHNREVRSLSERELDRIRGAEMAIVFQDSMLALNPVLRVCDQIGEVIRAHKERKASTVTEDVLRLVGLSDSQRVYRAYPHQTSGGEAAIAQALAAGLVVTDEPSRPLMPRESSSYVHCSAILSGIRGVSFLVISHSPDVLASITDYKLVMNAGKIVESRSARNCSELPFTMQADSFAV